MDAGVFEVRRLLGPFEQDAPRFQGGVQRERFFPFPLTLKFGFAAESFLRSVAGFDLCRELLQRSIVWFELEASIDSVFGFRKLV
jgi:hypothetical protein